MQLASLLAGGLVVRGEIPMLENERDEIYSIRGVAYEKKKDLTSTSTSNPPLVLDPPTPPPLPLELCFVSRRRGGGTCVYIGTRKIVADQKNLGTHLRANHEGPHTRVMHMRRSGSAVLRAQRRFRDTCKLD